jgi:hypothetical protein
MKQTKPGKSDFWINGKIKGQKMVWFWNHMLSHTNETLSHHKPAAMLPTHNFVIRVTNIVKYCSFFNVQCKSTKKLNDFRRKVRGWQILLKIYLLRAKSCFLNVITFSWQLLARERTKLQNKAFTKLVKKICACVYWILLL